MLRLRMFGGLSIDNGGRKNLGAAGQLGRLAILAVICVRDTGVSREKLLALFWPESDAKRASGALRQALYALRRDLNEKQLTVGTSVLRPNADVVTSDVADFRRLVAANDLQTAAAAYTGPFLDAIHLGANSEVEHWIEQERVSLESEYREVLEQLVGDYQSRGHHNRAIECCRKITALDVLSEAAASMLLDAFVAAGNVAAALHHARAFERLMAQELGTAPTPAFAAKIRAIMSHASPPSAIIAASNEAPVGDALPQLVHAQRPPRFDSAWRMATIAVAAIASLAAGVFALSPTTSRHSSIATSSSDSPRVVVTFSGSRNAGDSALATILSAVARSTLETIGLRGHADRTPVLNGIVTQADGKVLVSASLFPDAGARTPLSQTSAAADRAELDLLTVQVIARLIGPLLGPGVSDIANAASATANSAEALTEFLAGERHYRAARFGPAADAFQRAVSHDSLFALGWYRLSTACDWAGRDRCINEADSQAVALRSRVGEHYELLIQALHAWHRGDGETAERAYAFVTVAHPSDPETWYQLADARFHLGPLRGVPIEESRDAFERSLALMPQNRDAMIHLARLAAIRTDAPAADSLFAAAIALSGEDDAKELRLVRIVASGDTAAFERFLNAGATMATDDLLRLVALRVVMFGGRRDEARRLTSILAGPSRPVGTRVLAHIRLAELNAIEGHLGSAMNDLRNAETLAFGTRAAAYAAQQRQFMSEFVYFMQGLALDGPIGASTENAPLTDGRGSFPHTGQNDLRDFADRYVGANPALVAKLISGIRAVRSGDTATAASVTRTLQRWPDRSKRDTAQSCGTFLEAVRAFADGRYATAVAKFAPHPWGPLWYAAKPAARYLHALALARLGRTDEALQWYATFWDVATEEQLFAAPAHYQRGRIFEQRREWVLAAAEFREVGAIWRAPDAPLLAIKQDAAVRLSRLEAFSRQRGGGREPLGPRATAPSARAPSARRAAP